jgi:spermidine synthase
MSYLPPLLFASGFAGLVYQVLWQKQLGYLLGSSAHATATAVAVFFLGLTLGQLWAGRRAAGLARPLATYARLEVAIAVAALSYFALDPVLQVAFPHLFAVLGDGMLLGPARAALAALVLLPAATLMGATLPVLAEAVGRRTRTVAGSVAGLYAANTFGAAAGALAAGFWLPQAFGLRGAYAVAIGITTCVGVAAWMLAGRAAAPVEAPVRQPGAVRRLPASATLLALLSGFLALALQVLWTRMFAQVLHNSVYSFAAILVVFLASLGLGAWGARLLARRAVAPEPTLGVLLLASGVTVAASPLVFFALTEGLGYVAREEAWVIYLLRVFALVAVVVGVPCTTLGLVFPYLLKVYERSDRPGELVGQLAAANTLGAIAGSVLAGFVLLPILGLWVSLRLVAVLYLGATVWAADRAGAARRAIVGSASLALVLLLTIADPGRLPAVKIDSAGGEALLSLREGAYGTVAVVARGERPASGGSATADRGPGPQRLLPRNRLGHHRRRRGVAPARAHRRRRTGARDRDGG